MLFRSVSYLSEHGISTLDELDAALSSVSDQADAIREGMKTAEKRMKELQKLIEYGKNYTEYKPIHDELKKLKNGWTNKRDKYEEAHRAELTLSDERIEKAIIQNGARLIILDPIQAYICLLYTSNLAITAAPTIHSPFGRFLSSKTPFYPSQESRKTPEKCPYCVTGA